MNISLVEIGLLAVAGFLAGYVNTIAGAGSLLTLPVLIFTGLDAVSANATNRIAVLFQTGAAVYTFRRGGFHVDRTVWWLALPMTATAIVGSYASTLLSDRQMRGAIAIAMLAFLVFSLWPVANRESKPTKEATEPVRFRWSLLIGLPLIGLYAGFLQAGVGILILFYLAVGYRTSLVSANVAKAALIFVVTAGAIFVFWASGTTLDIPRGVALAIATTVGGYLGAKHTIRGGERIVRIGVIVAVLGSAAKLLWDVFA